MDLYCVSRAQDPSFAIIVLARNRHYAKCAGKWAFNERYESIRTSYLKKDIGVEIPADWQIIMPEDFWWLERFGFRTVSAAELAKERGGRVVGLNCGKIAEKNY